MSTYLATYTLASEAPAYSGVITSRRHPVERDDGSLQTAVDLSNCRARGMTDDVVSARRILAVVHSVDVEHVSLLALAPLDVVHD